MTIAWRLLMLSIGLLATWHVAVTPGTQPLVALLGGWASGMAWGTQDRWLLEP